MENTINLSGSPLVQLRVLNLIQSLARGGAERQLVYLTQGLVGLGYDVHVGFLDGGPNFVDLECCGATLYHLGNGEVGRARGRGPHNYDPRIVLRLMRLIRGVQPDLVQTWITQMDILGGIACRLSGVPWVMREPSSGCAYAGSIKAAVRTLLGRRAQAIVANSQGGLQFWRRHAPKVPCYVVPNGAPLEEQRAAGTRAVELPRDKKHVLYAGRFTVGKNVATLTRAAVDLVRQDPTIMVTLCGEGPERERMARFVEESGEASGVRLPGETADVLALMTQADVFVSVSRFEGQPNSVLEAMACRCPLVVSDIAAHREFLDENSAFFVSCDSAADIAEGIRAALREREEAGIRAERARGIAERYSITAMTQRYERIYRKVLGGSAGSVAGEESPAANELDPGVVRCSR